MFKNIKEKTFCKEIDLSLQKLTPFINKINISNKEAFSEYIQSIEEGNFFNVPLKKTFNSNKPYITKLTGQHLLADIEKEFLKLENFQNKISLLYEDQLSEFGLLFVYPYYFMPSLLKLLELNIDVIYQAMPYVHEVQLNLVQVNVLKESVCLHNDHNSGIRNKFQLLEQLKETINFHIAITESNHDNAPFVIWVESKNEIITPRYCYKYLLDNNYLLNNDEKNLWTKILYYAENTPGNLLPHEYHTSSLALMYKFFQTSICKKGQDIKGVYAELKPLETLVFSSDLLHSSRIAFELSKTSERKSIIFRLSETKLISEIGSITKAEILKSVECIDKIFGYDGKILDILNINVNDYNDFIFFPFHSLKLLNNKIKGLNSHYNAAKNFLEKEEYELSSDSIKCIKELLSGNFKLSGYP